MSLSATGRSWALLENGLLVFERPAEGSGTRRLLVSRVELCTARDCECRDVTLRSIGLEVGAGTSSPDLSLDALRDIFAAGAMESRLDLDFGAVEPDDYEGRVPLSEDWVELLNSQVDGELLDELHERWLRAKAWRSREPHEIQWPSDPHRLVGWHETHPDLRQDLFLLDDEDRVFMAEEMFCLKPACTCDEATVDFLGCIDAKENRWRSIGGVRARIADGAAVRFDPEPGEDAAIRNLWNEFSKRHRVAERLNTHRGSLRSARRIAPPIAATPKRKTERAGRNDPCPCGSGQKYKRCCLRADQGTA